MAKSGQPQIRVKDKIEGAFDAAGVQGLAAFLKKHIDLGQGRLKKGVRDLVHNLKEKGAEGAQEAADFYAQMFPRASRGLPTKGSRQPTLTVSKANTVTVRLPAGFSEAGADLPREERVIDGRRVVLLLGPPAEAAPPAAAA